MGGAPNIVTLAAGVQFEPGAAGSFLRLVKRLGRVPDVNSTYRDFIKQLSMFRAWEDWVAGRGPKPAHSRAIHPDESKHCQGLAWDSDDWTTPGFNDVAAEYGFIRTAANDPTERHHYEYQWWNDQHRNDPTPASIEEALRVNETKEIEAMEAYVTVPSGAVVHLFPGGRHVFASQQEYETYGREVQFIRDRGGLDMAPIPALSNVVGVSWATFERLRDNFGVPDDDAFGGGTIDVEALAKDLATRMGFDPSAVRAAVRAELASLTLKAG